MVNYLFYLLIGFAQGMLEWLPVSSEGQIVLISIWQGIDPSVAISLAFWLHLGTLGSVLLIFRKEWKRIIDLRKEDKEKLRNLIIFSTIGTAIVGIPVRIFLLDIVDTESFAKVAMIIIAVSLIITGLLIQFSRKTHATNKKSLADLSVKEQLILGLAQGFTIIPGISRSGTTVSALLFMGTDTESSFRGSFIISVPAVLGSVVLDIVFSIIDNEPLLEGLDPLGIILSIIMAFVLGVITIKILLNVARNYNFALLVIILGMLILLFLLF